MDEKVKQDEKAKEVEQRYQKQIAEAQLLEDFSQSLIWKKLKEAIDRDKKNAEDAWKICSIDGKPDSEIVRNLCTQRGVVRTCEKIVSYIESASGEKKQLIAELEQFHKKMKNKNIGSRE